MTKEKKAGLARRDSAGVIDPEFIFLLFLRQLFLLLQCADKSLAQFSTFGAIWHLKNPAADITKKP
jgi:hypothetical protein